jgi:IS30 family transposase
MTDATINELSRASSLKVISRTSIMRYKNTNKSVAQIARELDVDGVIEGSVLREGNRVRINAQLIDGKTEQQLWTDSFERDERNVLALQAEIAHAIMRQLRVRLGKDENWVVQPASVDPEAYDALLKARFYTYRITLPTTRKPRGSRARPSGASLTWERRITFFRRFSGTRRWPLAIQRSKSHAAFCRIAS